MLIFISFGFNEILVVKGKKPTHPNTLYGDIFLPENPQVQYFSFSTGGAPPSGEGWDTVFDQQIPVDSNGDYTVVVSWRWNRPNNAIIENGVVWIDPGEGEGHYIGARGWISLLYIRFQGNNPNWRRSPSNIPMPSTSNPIPMDAEVMGPYYPRSVYMSKNYFEKTYFQN